MRQPAEAMPGRLAYKLVCCRMSRDGERSVKGGGEGGPRAGNGGHERALHRVPRRTFVKLRDDFVWDEPQVAVATVACAAAARAGPRKSRFSLIGLGGSSRYGGRFNVHDNAQR
jgi:hypothetical protein